MIIVSKKHMFSAAHRLYDYNGQCENLHGHNYEVEINLTQTSLNHLGMVVDFSDIKTILLSALDQIWDHKTLLYNKDPLCAELSKLLNDGSVCPLSFNPTAENMAIYLGQEFFPSILSAHKSLSKLKIVSIKIYETPHNLAIWKNDEFTVSQ